MTIYRVERDNVGKADWAVVKADILPDGDHIIEHRELLIPIFVDGDEVTVHVDQVTGDLQEGYVCGGEYTTFDRLQMRRDLHSMVMRPKDGTAVVHIFGKNDGRRSVLVERHDIPPAVYGERET